MNAHRDAQDAHLTPSPAGVARLPAVDVAAVLRDHAPNGRFVTHCFVEHEAGTLCMACYRPWQGDAESGGCEAALLAREVVALRERAEAERERRESAENNMASWEETATRFVERVALLEGLLREVCDAVIDVAYWRSKHNGRRQRHAVVVLEDTVRGAIAALADGG